MFVFLSQISFQLNIVFDRELMFMILTVSNGIFSGFLPLEKLTSILPDLIQKLRLAQH